MSQIPEDKFRDILKRSHDDILGVISTMVVLKASGKNHVGLCPFHSEKSPSFTVTPHKKLFKCFGCGKGGSVVAFVMEYRRCSFIEAVHFLANHFNIIL